MIYSLQNTKENLERLERGEKTRDEEKAGIHADRNCCSRFWRNVKVHVAIITVAAATIMYFGVNKAFQKDTTGVPPLPDAYVVTLTMIDVVSAIFFGVGCAWSILAAIAISKRVLPQHQRPGMVDIKSESSNFTNLLAWASYVAIAYIFLSDWLHVNAHFYVVPGDWWVRTPI